MRLDRGPLVCKTFANDRAELVLPEGRAEQLDHRHPQVRQVKIAIGAAVLVRHRRPWAAGKACRTFPNVKPVSDASEPCR